MNARQSLVSLLVEAEGPPAEGLPTEGYPPVGTISFRGLGSIKDLAIVVLGAGDGWMEGLSDDLRKRAIVPPNTPQVFKAAYNISGNVGGTEGRTDLVLVFDIASRPNVGKLAMWRLQYGGQISWLDDFMVNYRKDYA
jgi:hypothetical protein